MDGDTMRRMVRNAGRRAAATHDRERALRDEIARLRAKCNRFVKYQDYLDSFLHDIWTDLETGETWTECKSSLWGTNHILHDGDLQPESEPDAGEDS